GHLLLDPIQSLLGGRVTAVGQFLLRRVTGFTGVLQADIRIDAHGEGLPFPSKPVVHPPIPGPVRLDQEVEAPAIAEFVLLLPGLRIAAGGVGQWHGDGISLWRYQEVPSDVPTFSPDTDALPWTLVDNRGPKS